MPHKNHLLPPTSKRPFATTAERYNDEHSRGNVKGSNFPHHEVRSLPGYSERGQTGPHRSRRDQRTGPLPRRIRKATR